MRACVNGSLQEATSGEGIQHFGTAGLPGAPDGRQLGDGEPLGWGDRDFRQIIESLPAAIYTTDAEGRITFYNDAAASLWGRQPAIGEEWWCGSWRLYRADGTLMPHHECPMAIALKTGQPVRGAEAIAERPDGTRFSFLPYPTPLFGADGRIKGAVNMLVDVTERLRAEEATQRLAAIVASSEDAIVSKTLNGIVTSWNEAAQRLFGYAPAEIIGRSILTLIPADRHDEEVEIVGRIRRGERIEHYETVRQRKDGSLFDISITVSPIKREDGTIVGASKIARDISGRKRAEAMLQRQAYRLATLNRVSQIISRDLDLDRIVQSVTNIATELSGARFGAFVSNIGDGNGQFATVCTSSGAPEGAFESLGLPPRFTAEIIRSDDIRSDPRFTPAPAQSSSIASYLAVPAISSSGEVLGGLFFGHDEANRFDAETESLISSIAGQAAVAIDNARLHKAAQREIEQRRQAEAGKELLLHEIKHRVKNTLAMVQAMASQTFRDAPPEESGAFVARLHALAEAHDLLTRQDWNAVDMGDIVERALRPFADEDSGRIVASGPSVAIDSGKALLFAMALHELGTNAVKYGALSGNGGKVEIQWALDGSDTQPCLAFCWRESGGPSVTPPERRGFGSRMIERALKGQQGSARFDFAHEGLTCLIEVALHDGGPHPVA